MILQMALLCLLSFLLSWVAVGAIRKLAPRLGFIDVPNQRSSHAKPTPRAGGLGFVVAVPAVLGVATRWLGIELPAGTVTIVAGGLLVALVGLADDRWHLPIVVRLAAFLAAAALPVTSGLFLSEIQWPGSSTLFLGWLGAPLTLLWIVSVTNIYNFMDGIDGIAGVQAVIAAGTAGLVAMLLGAGAGPGLFACLLASGVLGFLFHNWPPARIFMGDAGSAFLGYTMASLAVLAGSHSPVPFALWVILLAPFMFDASLTLVTRIARGERWYEPHRQHLYQRLVRRGWTHLRVTSVYLAADLFLAILVVLSASFGIPGLLLLLGTAAPLLGIFALVKWQESVPPSKRQGKSRPA